MNNSLPRISIVTTCYNASSTIKDTIKSVQMQTYKNYEHLIIDGASTDGTADIARQLADDHTLIISEKDCGIYDGMNKGVKMASGDVVGMLNADDMYYDEHALEYIVSAFGDAVDCVHGDLIFVDPYDLNKVIRNWKSHEYRQGLFGQSWTPAHPTFYCKTSAYRQYGYYRMDFKIAADVELMYRFLEKHKLCSKYIPYYLVRMRHGGNSTRDLKSTWIITKEVLRGISENGGNASVVRYIVGKMIKARKQLVRS